MLVYRHVSLFFCNCSTYPFGVRAVIRKQCTFLSYDLLELLNGSLKHICMSNDIFRVCSIFGDNSDFMWSNLDVFNVIFYVHRFDNFIVSIAQPYFYHIYSSSSSSILFLRYFFVYCIPNRY